MQLLSTDFQSLSTDSKYAIVKLYQANAKLHLIIGGINFASEKIFFMCVDFYPALV